MRLRGADSAFFAHLALGLILVAAIGWLIHLGSGTTFFRDEWDFLLFRDISIFNTYMASHNGQQVYGMSAFCLTMLNLFGFSDYLLYRLATLMLVAGCSLVVYYFARRRMGDWGRWLRRSSSFCWGALRRDPLATGCSDLRRAGSLRVARLRRYRKGGSSG